jgi:uncharacterized SAM-binding protein YcdF (DUF218 family)
MLKQSNLKEGSLKRVARRFACVAVIILAGLFVSEALVASTPIPDRFIEWLSCSEMEPKGDIRYIVILGHDIPSQAGLMCAYYAAEFGRNHPGIKYVVAMPTDEEPDRSAPGRIRDELMLRGVSAADILYETEGLDTHQQVVFVHRLLGDEALAEPFLIVTAPAHTRRALLCFRKEGFTRSTGLAATDISAPLDLGPWVFFRYTLWARLEAEATIAREFTALLVYKFRGWI